MRLPTVTRRALPALVGTVACALAAGACRPPDVTSRVLGGDPPAARGTAAAAAPARFVHPGVLVSRPQLRFVRAQVRAGRQPWDAAFAAMMA